MHTHTSPERQADQGRRGNAVITFLLLVGFFALASAALFPSAEANVSMIVSQLRSLLL